MSNVHIEGNLQFTFPNFVDVEKFDDKQRNAYGMLSADFVAETTDKLYLLEVKDFQNPKAPTERIAADLEMMQSACKKGESIFCLKMGQKVKDSLLRKYAQGDVFSKSVHYLLFVNFDLFGSDERTLLKTKISGFVPTGLNDNRFPAFTNISFDLVNVEQLKNYGIICEERNGEA